MSGHKVLGRMALGAIVPSVPVLVWWKYAVDNRRAKEEEVRTRVRVPNVQSVHDLLVEKVPTRRSGLVGLLL